MKDPKRPGGIWKSDALMKIFRVFPTLNAKVFWVFFCCCCFLNQCHSWNATAKYGDGLMVYVYSLCFWVLRGFFLFSFFRAYIADLDLNWTCHAGVHMSWFSISPVLVAIVTSRHQKQSGKEESSFKQACPSGNALKSSSLYCDFQG